MSTYLPASLARTNDLVERAVAAYVRLVDAGVPDLAALAEVVINRSGEEWSDPQFATVVRSLVGHHELTARAERGLSVVPS